MANKNVEGAIGAILTDVLKDVCEHCNGSEFMFSLTFDDVNHVKGELASLGITCAGGIICGLVLMCAQCGHEQTRLAWILDVAASNGTTLTMTNLDSSVANNLAGYFAICLAGTDVGKVFTIATNTAAAPTVITPSVAPNADADGYFLITEFVTEYTAAS